VDRPNRGRTLVEEDSERKKKKKDNGGSDRNETGLRMSEDAGKNRHFIER